MMMPDFRSALDNQTYLVLNGIQEGPGGVLRLVLGAVAKSSAARDIAIGGTTFSGVVDISADQSTPEYEITFPSYIAYSVRNESYASQDKTERWEGDRFRVYSSSRFLDFVRATTFASSEYPGPFVHYSVLCQDHVVDIATIAQPKLNRLH